MPRHFDARHALPLDTNPRGGSKAARNSLLAAMRRVLRLALAPQRSQDRTVLALDWVVLHDKLRRRQMPCLTVKSIRRSESYASRTQDAAGTKGQPMSAGRPPRDYEDKKDVLNTVSLDERDRRWLDVLRPFSWLARLLRILWI